MLFAYELQRRPAASGAHDPRLQRRLGERSVEFTGVTYSFDSQA